MRYLARLSVLAILASAAVSAQFAEYQLKAGYLYNFATYTQWPDSVGEELTLCVYGQDRFGESLERLAGRSVGARTLRVQRIASVALVTSCQIVFVSSEAVSNLVRLEEAIKGEAVLLIADSPGAAAAGVTINMLTADGRIGFEINLRHAQQHRLNLSAQLLRLAQEVLR